jgi:Nucleoplasmin-like domain
MSSRPLALWHLKVPSGEAKAPGYDEEEGYPLPYRITMAAIDSSVPSSKPSTLKLHRKVITYIADDDDEDGEEEGESREEETIICTLESGKVRKFLRCQSLMLALSTDLGHHYPGR